MKQRIVSDGHVLIYITNNKSSNIYINSVNAKATKMRNKYISS